MTTASATMANGDGADDDNSNNNNDDDDDNSNSSSRDDKNCNTPEDPIRKRVSECIGFRSIVFVWMCVGMCVRRVRKRHSGGKSIVILTLLYNSFQYKIWLTDLLAPTQYKALTLCTYNKWLGWAIYMCSRANTTHSLNIWITVFKQWQND